MRSSHRSATFRVVLKKSSTLSLTYIAVDLPPWLVCILGVTGGGFCVATVVVLALLPLAIVAVVVTGVA